jgi:hypothetical protein
MRDVLATRIAEDVESAARAGQPPMPADLVARHVASTFVLRQIAHRHGYEKGEGCFRAGTSPPD